MVEQYTGALALLPPNYCLTENTMATQDNATTILRSRMDAYWKEVEAATTPPELFHYTDANGLLGIIKAGQLWCSDVLCMNDPTEFEYGKRIIAEVLESYRDRLPEHGFADPTNNLGLGDTWRIFTISFCARKDLLSQWRGYGALGGGYAISFSTPELMRMADPTQFAIFPLHYDRGRQRDLVTGVVEAAIDIAKQFGIGRESASLYWHEVGIQLLSAVVRLKNPGFAEEEEWRIMMIAPDVEPQFRAGRLGILPYVALQFLPRVVVSVMEGPSRNAEYNAKALRFLLDRHGMEHVRVLRSAIPLR